MTLGEVSRRVHELGKLLPRGPDDIAVLIGGYHGAGEGAITAQGTRVMLGTSWQELFAAMEDHLAARSRDRDAGDREYESWGRVG